MVSNLDRKRLNTAIAEAISDAVVAVGYAVHPEIKQRVTTENAEIVARISAELADAEVGKMVSSHLRRWTKIKTSGARQLSLPGVSATVLEDVPALITVPAPDVDVDSVEDVDERPDTKHIAIDQATVGEVRRYWKLLDAHRKSIDRRLNAVGFILRRCDGAADDQFIVEALKSQTGEAA